MSNVEFVSKEPIAIVGLGCVLPDAPDVETFWNNLLAGKDSVREVPKSRWDPALFWSADKASPDKTYAKIGAFVSDDAFNPLDYRMLPASVVQIDPSQRWALAATRQALKDAGLRTGLKADEKECGREFDRSRTAVILGNAMGGELMKLHTKRLYWPQVEAALRADAGFRTLSPQEQEDVLRRTETIYKSDVPPVTEDSMPGTLANVAAGRIANVFDLGGKNFTTDAACASSLAALDSAIDTLRKGEADIVIWGGTDRSMDVTPYVEFSKIGALSPDGSRPFDAGANGFVMGEGCAIFLLKRLSDAERDGDKVYAVVRGLGGSSDGKGKGITAPNPVGQVKAVVRAYQDAEVDPFTVGYLEAHGTSTPVGDPVELTSVEEAYRQLSKAGAATGSIFVGSVKSNMGHLKSAAGAVGM
ncbi:MAG TPA: polyketide synthase, partial [Candidatus Thermoplasmatota archaeon]|nr:polyketide synthase [Candidatus Thermoplasmatota archaeon]